MNQSPIDIAATVYEKLESSGLLPDHAAGVAARLGALELMPGTHNALWDEIIFALATAQEQAFRLGWQMRGQV